MSTLVAQTLSNGSVSTSTANCIQGSAKAWVNWNGTNGTIRASYNVSSVTRSATGTYVVNFTNALSDANYSVSMGSMDYYYGSMPVLNTGSYPATTSCAILAYQGGTNASCDPVYMCASFFR